MRNYTWYYGIFHWFMHYIITIALIIFSGILIFPIFVSYTLFGIYFNVNIMDHLIAILITSFLDLDHISVLKKFGFKKYIFAEKRVIAPLHNFFFLSVFSILATLMVIFFSRVVGVLIFVVVLHMVWDIFEDVVIFRTSFRRWERTWGLDKKELEETYNELLKTDLNQLKKKSKIIRKKIQ